MVVPILSACFLFDALGKKSQPEYDCYANNDDEIAIPGVMDMDDEYYVNVTRRFDIILWL